MAIEEAGPASVSSTWLTLGGMAMSVVTACVEAGTRLGGIARGEGGLYVSVTGGMDRVEVGGRGGGMSSAGAGGCPVHGFVRGGSIA